MTKRKKAKYQSAPAHKPAPSPQTIPKNNTPNAHPNAQSSDAKKNPPDDKLDLGMLRWTRVVGIFTTVLAIIGFIQAWSFIQNEHAFLSITAVDLEGGQIIAEKPVAVGISIKNSGRSPAAVTNFNVMLHVAANLPAAPLYGPMADEVAVPPIVGGGIIRRTVKFPKPDKTSTSLGEDQVLKINSGELFLYIYGFVQYEDDFSWFRDRRLGYCVTYNPKGAPNLSLFDTCKEKAYTYAN